MTRIDLSEFEPSARPATPHDLGSAPVDVERAPSDRSASDRSAQGAHRTVVARRVAIELGIAYALLTLTWILIGRVILGFDVLVDTDESVSADLAANRTAGMDDFTAWGSLLSDTMVKIVVTALVAAAAFAVWRKWRDVWMLVLSLVLEASVFITVTWVIARPRPDVMRLEESPVDSSFPSGHVAAAAAYGALVVVVAWHTRRWWLRAGSALVVAVVVAIVAWSRVYRGMHYLSDVTAGAALGIASIAAVWWIIRRHDPERTEAR
jgi:undecaprenyl-diphosphatase